MGQNLAIDSSISPMARRAAISSALGSALEWIDFATYGVVAATVLPAQFFPAMDPSSAVLASFATFGVGFFARPVGGLVFGILGDRIGRSSVLLFTLALMGFASLFIGLLPTYARIGLWAPGLLVMLRFLQGVALGGEATGAQLLTMEHAPAKRRGMFGSFINLGSSISQVAANGLLFIIARSLSPEQFLSFGWRIPFVMSVLLVALAGYIRLNVAESPAFAAMMAQHSVSMQTQRRSMRFVVRHHGGTVLRLLLVWAAPATCFYIVNVFSLSYLTNTVGVPSQVTFLCLMGANLVAVLAMIAGGVASDRWGRKPPMIAGLLIMLGISLVYFPLLGTGKTFVIFLAMAVFVGSLQVLSGVQPAFFAENFPTSARYFGSAMAYTGANMLFAGPTPFVAAWLMREFGGNIWVLTAMVVLIIGVSLGALLLGPETRGIDLIEIHVGELATGIEGSNNHE